MSIVKFNINQIKYNAYSTMNFVDSGKITLLNYLWKLIKLLRQYLVVERQEWPNN